MTKTVLIYGCGRTGTSIAKKLGNVKIYTLRGKEIQGCKKVQTISDIAEKLDCIILAFTATGPDFSQRTGWEMRESELEGNIQLAHDFAAELKKTAQTPEVIVVSNPADTIAKYLKEIHGINSIPFGIKLDSKRYSNIWGSEVKAIGAHGLSVPLLGLEKRQIYENLIDECDAKLVEHLQTHGINYKLAGTAFVEFFANKEFNPEKKEPNHIERTLLLEREKFVRAQYEKALMFHKKI